VIGVAFDLGGTSLVAFHEQPQPRPVHRHRCREKQRLAGHFFLWLPHVGHDFLVRLPRAGAHAGQRQRGAHQLQETAASNGIEPLRGVLGELAVKEFLEFRRLGERFEAAPVLPPAGGFQAGSQPLDVVAFFHVRVTHR
jgi:hypothetical protein